jgi:hypothetical protein
MDAERLEAIKDRLRRRDEIAEQMQVHTAALKIARSVHDTVEHSRALNKLLGRYHILRQMWRI